MFLRLSVNVSTISGSQDPCVFYSIQAPRLILALWVDDGLVMCSDQTLLRKLISHLQTKFEVTVGDPDVYVGLHITQIFRITGCL